jgi:hypothetical protein
MAATNMAKINIRPTGKIFSSQDLQNILKQIYTWSFTKIMVFSLIGNDQALAYFRLTVGNFS